MFAYLLYLHVAIIVTTIVTGFLKWFADNTDIIFGE